ncbi:MAG: M1 family metallopeptidase [Dermatophilaceae bacterium]|nr:M1 family metallopeptidase [Dermatophilaceae bacterium]
MSQRAQRGPHDVQDPDPYLPGHGDLAFEVESYEIRLDYRVSSNRLDAWVEIVAVANQVMTLIRLDLHGLEVSKVRVNGNRPARYSSRGGKLRIRLAAAVARGDRLVIVVRYGGQPGPVPSIWGDVGWEELSDGVIVAGQPGGAPSWFPCNDRPDSKATYRMSVTTESAYAVLANGLLVGRRRGASRTTWTYEQSQPMATYLATVQIGRYERRTLAGSAVPVGLLAPPKLQNAAMAAFALQPAMLRVFADLFGPYPFDEYTVVVTPDDLEIPLEAQGLAVFGANHIDGRLGLERLVAHELAHQWFGNSLTLGHLSDIWLHEGFACYAEWLWSERSGGRSADALARRHHRRLAGAAQDLLLADPGPAAVFDDRVYKRGALALHALRLALGDDAFFAMIRAWASEHRFGTVSTKLFEEHAARYGRAGALLRRWLHGMPLPDLPPA